MLESSIDNKNAVEAEAPQAEISPNITEYHRGGDCLNDNRLAAIELLLLGRKIGDIAKALDVHRRTIWVWRKEPAFCEELNRRRAELWSRASRRLAAMVHPALDVLESDLGDRWQNTRFRAASAVLRLADLKKMATANEDVG